MTLADVPAGATVFVNANILIFALTNHPTRGRLRRVSRPG
jgi:hypothetical protein